MKKTIIFFLVFISIICLYGFFINPNGYKITNKKIAISSLDEHFQEFKIMQISDTLITDKNDLKIIKDIVNDSKKYKPDIIIFTGNLLNSKHTLSNDDINTLSNYLKDLYSNIYKYATIGSNDKNYLELYKSIFNNADIYILDNESKYIFNKGITPIKITGFTDIKSNKVDNGDNLDTILNIAITSNSDNFDKIKNEDIDLVFAGNSLKGQINIPFYGGLIKFNGSKKYINEYYEENNKRLYISGGLGTRKIKFRLFNKPEVNIYTLTNE